MPHYRHGFTPEQFEALKAALLELGQSGPFDANDALACLARTGVARNAGDVATILGDLVDLGYLRRLRGPDVDRFELSDEAT